MKKILVPCDFSKTAVNALRVAISIAKRTNASIHLLFVIELPVMNEPILVTAADYEFALKEEFRQYATKKFSSLLEKFNDGNASVSWMIKFGGIVRTIVDTISSDNFDLVVMGSNGASGMREYIIGSNTEKVVRRSNVPVLVVKNFYVGPVRKIVFPCSADIKITDQFIAKLKELQNYFEAELHIVWINTPDNFVSDVTTYKFLNEFVKKHDLMRSTIHSFNEINETEGIIHFTQMISADMIAMATHGRKGLSHLFYGSTTESVVNHASNLLWTCVVAGTQKEEKKAPVEKVEHQ